MTSAAELYALQETELSLDRATVRLAEIEAELGESEELIEARQRGGGKGGGGVGGEEGVGEGEPPCGAREGRGGGAQRARKAERASIEPEVVRLQEKRG